MHPQGFILFGSELSSYELCLYSGMIITLLVSVFSLYRQRLLTARVLLCLLVMGILAGFGARGLNVLLNFQEYLQQTWRIFTLKPIGYSLYGGLILASIGAIIYCKIFKINFWKLADCLVYGMGTGIIIMKIGCFLNGCCFGQRSSMPWAVRFNQKSPAGIYYLSKGLGIFTMSMPKVHPTQLYEAAAALIGMITALIIKRKCRVHGFSALGFIIVFSFLRWVDTYLRVWQDKNHVVIYSFVYLVIIIVSILVLWRRRGELKNN